MPSNNIFSMFSGNDAYSVSVSGLSRGLVYAPASAVGTAVRAVPDVAAVMATGAVGGTWVVDAVGDGVDTASAL